MFMASQILRERKKVVFQANNNDLDLLCFWVIVSKQIPWCLTFPLKSSGMAKNPASGVGIKNSVSTQIVSDLPWLVFYFCSACENSRHCFDNCNFSTTKIPVHQKPCWTRVHQGTHLVQFWLSNQVCQTLPSEQKSWYVQWAWLF